MVSWGKTLALVIVAIFLLSLVTFSSATVKAIPITITVPDDYSDIQAAINHANDGDTVFVKSGLYSFYGYSFEDDLIVNKSISLIGENSQSTILKEQNYFNGQVFGAHALIYVQANGVTIQGLTLDGNRARSYGILSEYSHTRIVGNNIMNNTFNGILCEKPGIELFGNYILGNNITNNGSHGIGGSGSNSIISGNTLSQNPIAIEIDSSENVTITQNNIFDNGINNPTGQEDSGGGMDLRWFGTFNIYQNNVTNNKGYGFQFGEGCSNSEVYSNNIKGNVIGINVVNFGVTNNTNNIGIGFNNKVYGNNLDNHLNAFIGTTYDNFLDPYIIGNGTDSVTWDNGAIGNYWSDYGGYGKYVINENNIDYYPLTKQLNISAPLPTPTLGDLVSLLVLAIIVVIATSIVIVVALQFYRRHRKTPKA